MMRKRQPKHSHFISRIKSISVIGITVFSLGLTAINASAATLDTPETRTISQTATSDNNLPNQIQGFINDVRSFFRDDLFGNITQLVQSTIGSVEVPDLGQVVSQIMTGTFPEDGATSSKFENNLTNSYAIRLDLANQSERVVFFSSS